MLEPWSAQTRQSLEELTSVLTLHVAPGEGWAQSCWGQGKEWKEDLTVCGRCTRRFLSSRRASVELTGGEFARRQINLS